MQNYTSRIAISYENSPVNSSTLPNLFLQKVQFVVPIGGGRVNCAICYSRPNNCNRHSCAPTCCLIVGCLVWHFFFMYVAIFCIKHAKRFAHFLKRRRGGSCCKGQDGSEIKSSIFQKIPEVDKTYVNINHSFFMKLR